LENFLRARRFTKFKGRPRLFAKSFNFLAISGATFQKKKMKGHGFSRTVF